MLGSLDATGGIRTLLSFLTERLVEDICDRVKDVGIHVLLCVCVDEEYAYGPVPQREARDPRVGTWAVVMSEMILEALSQKR